MLFRSNSMAAVTVSDFYAKFVRPGATDGDLMRVARHSTIAWGVVQIAVALAAQWMDRSVLDAGLAVLSLASGPVLGAFLVGVFSKRVQAGAMLAGMIVGIAALVLLWRQESVAYTWYAFIGASVTAAVAVVCGKIAVPRSSKWAPRRRSGWSPAPAPRRRAETPSRPTTHKRSPAW